MIFLLVSLSSLRGFLLIKSQDFFPRFLIEFRKFFYQLTYTNNFFLDLSLDLGKNFPVNKTIISNVYILLKFVSKKKNNCNIIKPNNYIISHMTSHILDLTQSGWFNIITYFKIDLSLIIYYMTYLTFSINFYNQSTVN